MVCRRSVIACAAISLFYFSATSAQAQDPYPTFVFQAPSDAPAEVPSPIPIGSPTYDAAIPTAIPSPEPTHDDSSLFNRLDASTIEGLSALQNDPSKSPAEYNKAICALLLFWCTIGDTDACRLYRKYDCPA